MLHVDPMAVGGAFALWTKERVAVGPNRKRELWRRIDGYAVVDIAPEMHDRRRPRPRDRWAIVTPPPAADLGPLFGVSAAQAMAFCDALRPVDDRFLEVAA